MNKLKNILIIFICFLMLSGFTNEETAVLESTQPLENIRVKSGAYNSQFPSSYDSRNSIVTFNNQNSENQGALSICWAFASNNIMEAYMNKHNSNATTPYNYSENLQEYVARYLGDISSYGAANSTFNVVKYMFYNLTPVNETTFDPNGYFINQKTKTLDSYMNMKNVDIDIRKVKLFNQYPIKALLDGGYSSEQIYYSIGQYNEQIKSHIYNHGAVMSVIYTKFLTTKADGSYGWCYNNGSQEESTYSASAHAITLIGWDDNYEWKESNAAPYKGAWLAANSWGSNTTFFYVSYFDVSIVRGIIGIEDAPYNYEITGYNKSYVVGESNAMLDYSDNKIKYYNRESTESKSETFTYYIGEEKEKIVEAKLLYYGFNNYNYVINDLQVRVEVSDGTNTTFNTVYNVNPGITTISLTNKYVSGNITVKITITTSANVSISNMIYTLGLYTNNQNTVKKIFSDSKTNYSSVISSSTNSSYVINYVTKNINPTEKANIAFKALDANSNDITSKFTVTKNDITFNSTRINLTRKSSLNTTAVTFKLTVGSTTGIINVYDNYSIHNLDIDNNNKIIKYVSPNTTVTALLSDVAGGFPSVVDKNGMPISDTDNLATTNRLRISNQYYDITVLGDVNGDGEIDITDVMTVATEAIKGNTINTELKRLSANVNKDEDIDITDVMMIATYALKGVGL